MKNSQFLKNPKISIHLTHNMLKQQYIMNVKWNTIRKSDKHKNDAFN
jgi:hypothetical protein